MADSWSSWKSAHQRVCRDLLAERNQHGYWVGELSSSALSTATAISALSVQRQAVQESQALSDNSLVAAGVDWLRQQQNADGGWGDTDKSHSNIATTMLVCSAFQLAGASSLVREQLVAAERYLEAVGGLAGLRRRYGRDKTFAVPILTNCALAGRVDWQEVAALPFELACLPQAWYRFVQLPVVSYAIPALVAIGQARFVHRPPWNPVTRITRWLSVHRSLRVLRRMQPASGGFLEATPLTSFVVMSLASIGRAAHPVVQNGVRFLVESVRPDGSWPIDTNLATWNTTLSLNALAAGGQDIAKLGADCLDWLLACQHLHRHPFTGAAPGGWGWSDLTGAVPDADDTPGALLALASWRDAPSCTDKDRVRTSVAAMAGVSWLLSIQNRDGGWPTFCRGWGTLPFDRSGADLTAHAIRGLLAWHDAWPAEPRLTVRVERAVERGFAFLQRTQTSEGAWLPLWFGNQDHPREENPVYGTAKVILAYEAAGRLDCAPCRLAIRWLCNAQNRDGGWGGSFAATHTESESREVPVEIASPVSSVEETALALEALLTDPGRVPQDVISQGLNWLTVRVQQGTYRENSPIGFYFAKLWYHERLYPLVFAAAALGRAVRHGAFWQDSNASAES